MKACELRTLGKLSCKGGVPRRLNKPQSNTPRQAKAKWGSTQSQALVLATRTLFTFSRRSAELFGGAGPSSEEQTNPSLVRNARVANNLTDWEAQCATKHHSGSTRSKVQLHWCHGGVVQEPNPGGTADKRGGYRANAACSCPGSRTRPDRSFTSNAFEAFPSPLLSRCRSKGGAGWSRHAGT